MENSSSEVKHYKQKCVMYFDLPGSLGTSKMSQMMSQKTLGSIMENVQEFSYFMPSRYQWIPFTNYEYLWLLILWTLVLPPHWGTLFCLVISSIFLQTFNSPEPYWFIDLFFKHVSHSSMQMGSWLVTTIRNIIYLLKHLKLNYQTVNNKMMTTHSYSMFESARSAVA